MASSNLYVGNLPYKTAKEDLQDLFSQAGSVVSATVVMDRETNRSKGFGFVEMGSADEAAKAIEMFDGKEFDGRNIRVNEAQPKTERI